MSALEVLSPYSGQVVVRRPYASREVITTTVAQAQKAFQAWRATPLVDRVACARRFIEAFVAKRDVIGPEISQQMGRPIRFVQGEVNGLVERATYLADIAEASLTEAADRIPDKPGFQRYIRKEPLGVVLVIAPWNYPYLVAINAVLPALLAGNAVILKHAPQTPLCAERLLECFQAAGLPEHVFQYLHMADADCDWCIEELPLNFVCFTGSVATGRVVSQAACKQLLGTGLELGGKDPAYVRADADIAYAAEQLVDGAFFNSGQSCCSIERIYVHESVYELFIAKVKQGVLGYKLGDPQSPETTLGPVVNPKAAARIRQQVADALAAGAQALIPAEPFEAQIQQAANPAYNGFVLPQVLVNVDHSMAIMAEETFGPVVGIVKVASDAEAVRLMNDSAYGLTASVWTKDADAALDIGNQIDTGTWFMNRADYLDPALAWTGVKYSGRGCTLSHHGFDQFVRLKSYHLKLSE